MNGLPLAINLKPLIGAEILQVCFGEFQVVLNFATDLKIAVESTCIFQKPSVAPITITRYPEKASVLCQLIGARISSADRDSDGGLILCFADGARLHILNSNREYESFQLHIKEQTHVA